MAIVESCNASDNFAMRRKRDARGLTALMTASGMHWGD